MKPEQKIVVAWMKRIMGLRDWSAEQWSRRAGISPTTLTRAMRPSYDGVTSLPVLHKLAQAADTDSPLDLLRGRRVIIEIPQEHQTSERVAAMVAEVLQEVLQRRIGSMIEGCE